LYNTKQYISAAYEFERFSSSYPKSPLAEEAAFYGAECYSKVSPIYSLDQVDTDKALSKIQVFVNKYPNSTFLPRANEIVKELSEKLELKAFEIAKQYSTPQSGHFVNAVLDKILKDLEKDKKISKQDRIAR
jgi:outer membrane protein assembly factor BamD